ncbi:uncharacterized protein L199_000150 [Kwoniella botswanensis]|uniref:uncharacterized protein n=1 Tax=Kwoniella botswanensis TaxID=1268659 RepID=UPI00315D0D3A
MLDPTQYTIRIASAEQAEEHEKACFEMPYWRCGMNWDQFLEFGHGETQAEWVKDDAMLTWVLVRKDDYDGPVYSILATHRKKALIKPRFGLEVIDGYWYNITAVITPIEHRGHGYATHLIRLLHYILLNPLSPGDPPSPIPSFPIEWGSPPPPVPSYLKDAIPRPCASVLWADIPMSFYESCTIGLTGKGYEYRKEWNSRLVFDLHLDNRTRTVEGQDIWDLIHQEDLEEIKSILTESTKSNINKSKTSSKSLWTHDPSTKGSLTFIGTRGSFIVPPTEWKNNSKPLPLGVRLRSPTDEDGEDTAIVMFALENFLVEPRLLLTYVHNLQPDQVSSLLEVLEDVVRDTNAPWTQGEIWGFNLSNPSDSWVKELENMEDRNVKIDIRDGLRSHVLGVCNYLDEGAEMVDHQMWSWV